MVSKEDLIGNWIIEKSILHDSSDEKQSKMDKANSKYSITFNKNDTYKELNNSIILLRPGNFNGKFSVEDDVIKLYMRVLNSYRSYKIVSFNEKSGVMELETVETLYCSVYKNIKMLILKKT